MSETVDRLIIELSTIVDNVVEVDEIDSTHSLATRLIDQMDRECLELGATVVLANRQSAGVGRGGRSWESPPGGLYLSWIRSCLDAEMISSLPMLAAAAAHAAIARLGVPGVGIKWPNDIVVAGGKLAGILVHARHGELSWATIGLGVNLATRPELGADATLPPTSIAEHIEPAPLDHWRSAIASDFIRELTRSLAAPEAALTSWGRHLTHRPGDIIRVRLASGRYETGSFAGLTAEGFLRLVQEGRERVITSGEVIVGG